MSRKGLRREHQDPDPGGRDAEPDQKSADAGGEEEGARREEDAADRGDERGSRHQPARPEPVHENADRHLNRDVGVEVEGREMSDRGCADGELAHQLVDHDARRDALHERVKEEERADRPGDHGAAGGWLHRALH